MPDNSEQVKNRPELPWNDSYGDHIRILDGLIDENICDACIDVFDDAESRGLVHTRREFGHHNNQLSDSSMFLTEMDAMVSQPMKDIGDYVMGDIIESWQIKYPIIDAGSFAGVYNAQTKMQKTRPSEGYHNWHCESGSSLYDRTTILAWMVYLNDVEEGGETEFLYQSVRVPPVQGRFICWPAGWTHIHRGNPPLKGVKYALTGWINFIP